MDGPVQILTQVLLDVVRTVEHNWPYLLLSVVLASAIQVYVGTERLARWLRARTWVAVVGAVVLATFTPFCSCGTTAVVLGALASSVPWAPVVAFMVSSPLTSPSELVLSAGLFGLPFAVTFVVAAAVLGLLAGAVTHVLERAGLLAGQERVRRTPGSIDGAPDDSAGGATDGGTETSCGGSTGSCTPTSTVDPAAGIRTRVASTPAAAGTPVVAGTLLLEPSPAPCDGETACETRPAAPTRHMQFVRALGTNGRRLAVLFLGFATLGYLIIRLVPSEVMTASLGGDSPASVLVAATLGIPVYINSDASLPLVASLMEGGMGAGPALAFLTTGAGTSVGAIGGMLLIARWRVVALVVAILWVGAVALGLTAPMWL